MKVFAVRHGQAEHNRKFKLNDDPASRSDLTAKGRSQAESVAKVLADQPIEQIFTSQLPRAVQTAEHINHFHQVKLTTDSRLNENKTGYHGRSVGVWLGKRVLSRDHLNMHHASGETLLEAKARVVDFLNELKHKDLECVLLVAHQHTLQTLNSVLGDLDYAKALRRHVGHTELLEFEL